MKRLLALLALTGFLAGAGGQDARAVTWGEVDAADRYPFVGIVLTQISPTEVEICSGTLLSPTVFVTAAHCLDESILPFSLVAFGLSPLTPPLAFIPGIPSTHPDFVAIQMGPDVAILQLLGPVAMPAYAELADEGVLTEMATMRGRLSERVFRTVGYGIDGVTGYISEGKPGLQVSGLRRFGEQSLLNIEGATSFGGLYAHFSSNAGTLSGGACFGDSGGPVFLSDSNVIVAINSFGTNENCAGSNFTSRLDVETVLNFFDAFLP